MIKFELSSNITKNINSIRDNIVKNEDLKLNNQIKRILYKAQTEHKYKNRTGYLTKSTHIVINKTKDRIKYSLANSANYCIFVINKTKDNFLLKAIRNLKIGK